MHEEDAKIELYEEIGAKSLRWGFEECVYKTVITVTIDKDERNSFAALSTFHKYIAEHLYDNLVIVNNTEETFITNSVRQTDRREDLAGISWGCEPTGTLGGRC